MRVLSISTLFPNPLRPAFGIFVGNQMRAVAARGDVALTMISPVGIPPWPLCWREPHASLCAMPARSDVAGLLTHYPQFMTIPLIGGDNNPGRMVRAIRPLIHALHARTPFDMIDASFFFPDGPAAATIARELNLPLVIKARGGDIHYWGARPKARAQMLAAASQASALLSVSAALAQDMVKLGMPAEKISVHYTGLDRTIFRPINRIAARQALAQDPAIAIPRDGALLVATGALIPKKGQHLAIEALTHLPGTRLALAGTGPQEASLRRLTAALRLTDRVHFLGIVMHDTLPLLLSAADAMVLPSASEGLANAWIEALACGTPIVIPDVGGAREVVRSASAGRIVARNPTAIAEAVSDLVKKPISQNDVAENARHFSWKANAAKIVEIWRKACSGDAAPQPARSR